MTDIPRAILGVAARYVHGLRYSGDRGVWKRWLIRNMSGAVQQAFAGRPTSKVGFFRDQGPADGEEVCVKAMFLDCVLHDDRVELPGRGNRERLVSAAFRYSGDPVPEIFSCKVRIGDREIGRVFSMMCDVIAKTVYVQILTMDPPTLARALQETFGGRLPCS